MIQNIDIKIFLYKNKESRIKNLRYKNLRAESIILDKRYQIRKKGAFQHCTK